MQRRRRRCKNGFMWNKLVSICLVCCLLLSLMSPGFKTDVLAGGATVIQDLTTDYQKNPIGIDNQTPRFSWKMQSNVIGIRQTAYQIKVYEAGKADDPVWSRREETDKSVGVVYDGDYVLQPAVRYFWQVDVTDQNGQTYASDPAYFEMGVTNEPDWIEAEFIQLPASSSAPIFRTEKEVVKDVAEARLYITALGIFEAYIDGEQVGMVQNDGSIAYHHMSPGYGNGNITLNYETYDVTSYIKDKQAVALAVLGGTGWHDGVNATLGSYQAQPAVKALLRIVYTDGTTDKVVTNTADWKGTLAGPITMNSVYNGEDYDANREEALGEYLNINYDDSAWIGTGESGIQDTHVIKNAFQPTTAKYVRLKVEETGPGTPDDNEFRLQIMEWEIFDGQGNNVALRGTASSNDTFNWGNQWQITNINDGDDGVQSDQGYTSDNRGTINHYSNPITVDIELEDSVQIQGMNIHCRVGKSSFETGVCPNYPKVYTLQVSEDGMQWEDVEAYDAGKVINGYELADGITTKNYGGKIIAQNGLSGWIAEDFELQAVSATLYSGNAPVSAYEGGEIAVESHHAYEQPADDMYHNNLRIVDGGDRIFENGIEVKAGQTMVIDMGQNLTAVPYMEFAAEKGTEITLKFAEMLNDGSKAGSGAFEADGPKGSVYRKNLRGSRSAVKYIFAGEGIETYQTRLSFFGYQYIEVTATDDVVIYAVKSKAVSSVTDQTGYIETNNENVNRLFLNALYGQLSNYFTTPTDCPQRDERLAWTGDLQVFAQTALYNFDSVAFLNGVQEIMSTNTLRNGYPAAVLSLSGFFSHWATGWSDAEIIVAWNLYQQTGDTSILDENWEAMTAYMNYLKGRERSSYQAPGTHGNAYGDWLAFQGTGLEVIADYYYAYVVSLMAEMSEALGKKDETGYYKDYCSKIREKFLATHVNYEEVVIDYPLTLFDIPTPSQPGVSNRITNEPENAEGRYVRFNVLETGPGTADDREYRLQMMEVEIFGQDNSVNLAKGKSVSASSEFYWPDKNNPTVWAPQFLTDGNYNLGYTSANIGTNQHKWSPLTVTIDLGDVYEISKLDIYCRTDGQSMESGVCVNYPKQYFLEVSEDGENWDTVGYYNTEVTEESGSSLVIKSGTGSPIFMNKGGTFEDNSQTSLLWMLKLGFFDSDEMMEEALDLLIKNIKNIDQPAGSIRNNYDANTLSVGFLGSNVITPVLTDYGYSDVSYDLLLQDSMPSWLFAVKAGATTVWERWNSYSPGVGFGDVEMNSFNHYSYGSIAEWMYKYMAGITADTNNPGFKEIILQPTPDTGEKYNDEDRINQVSGRYDSYYGTIESNWEASDGVIHSYNAVVPANTSAVLYLPVEKELNIDKLPSGISFRGYKEHNGLKTAQFIIASGGYEFTVNDTAIEAAVADGYIEDITDTEVDKTFLAITIAYAEEQELDENLIPVVRQYFEDALSYAKSIYDDPEATQEEIDIADEQLIKAIQYLKFTADPTGLKSVIEDAKEKIESGKYADDENMDAYKKAVEDAEAILKADDSMQEDFEAAIEAILEAEKDLSQISEVNLSALQKEVTEALKINLDDYLDLEGVKEEFTAALQAAQNMLENPANQEEVNAVTARLRLARLALRLRPSKEMLRDLIDEINKTDFSLYTETSVKVLQMALADAIIVLNDPSADSAAVEQAYSSLDTAYQNLRLKDTETEGTDGTEDTDKPIETNNPEDTGEETKDTADNSGQSDDNNGQSDTKQSESKNNNSGKNDGKGKNNVKTGDAQNMAIWLVIITLSGLLVSILAVIKKRKSV